MGDQNKILGFDIGGSKCAVVLGDKMMRVHDRLSFPTRPHRGLKAVLQDLFKTIDGIHARNGLRPGSIHKAGVSCGGPMDCHKGLILGPPNLPGWNRVPIVRLLKKKLHCPVRLENDANACAVAEWKFGAGRGFRNALFLTFGTGMGVGMVLDGRLYRGTNDMAGEAGHVRLAADGPLGYGKKGSFEGFCSGAGIARMAKRKGLGVLSAKDVCEAANRGDKAARRILATSGSYLGLGLSMLLDILNPEVIIIGGIYSRSENFLEPEALKVIRREALSYTRSVCRIVPSGLGERIGDMAALTVAILDELEAGKD